MTRHLHPPADFSERMLVPLLPLAGICLPCGAFPPAPLLSHPIQRFLRAFFPVQASLLFAAGCWSCSSPCSSPFSAASHFSPACFLAAYLPFFRSLSAAAPFLQLQPTSHRRLLGTGDVRSLPAACIQFQGGLRVSLTGECAPSSGNLTTRPIWGMELKCQRALGTLLTLTI